jgi:hypothetical protein
VNQLLGILAVATMACGGISAQADCLDTPEREQLVYVHSGAEELSHWIVKSSELHRVRLPNGFDLGLQIEAATKEKYQEVLSRRPAASELVKITLFDMKSTPPRRLTQTWGGSNSFQSYGAKGGADRVEELGSPGVKLTLFKPSGPWNIVGRVWPRHGHRGRPR